MKNKKVEFKTTNLVQMYIKAAFNKTALDKLDNYKSKCFEPLGCVAKLYLSSFYFISFKKAFDYRYNNFERLEYENFLNSQNKILICNTN